MFKPKVSVIMSVYNGERYLRDSIKSILNQTFKDFELLIVDDGSTDNTKEILKTYKDPRINIITNLENIGLTKSLNKGIHIAKGEYIARQDADDVSRYNRLEKQVNYLELNKNIALLGTAIYVIDDKGDKLEDIEYPTNYYFIRQALKRNNCFCHGSVIFKKKIFEELGGYREVFETAQDYDLWLRFSEKYEVSNLKDRLYKYRFNPSSLTFKKVINQTRLAIFAREEALAREKGLSESSLMNKIEVYLNNPISDYEKKYIIKIYRHWVELLLKHNKKKEALLLMSELFRYNHGLYKILFKMAERLQLSNILKIIMRL